jgi:molybdate transport system ATP-binding protein
VDGHIFVDTDRGVFVPRNRRRLGYVFQEGRLFPHLTVRQNLLYGRWFAGRDAGPDNSGEVIELLGISQLLARRPGSLSGGEKQRVAIGRALLAAPRLLLMDEPLASLDEGRKAEILPYMERLRDELRIPIVYVSHSVAEVARLATEIAVISNGRVEAIGPAAEMLARPGHVPAAGRHEAGGILTVRVRAHNVEDELTILETRAGEMLIPRTDAAIGSELRIHIRARDVILAVQPPTGVSALNILPATVTEIGEVSGPSSMLRSTSAVTGCLPVSRGDRWKGSGSSQDAASSPSLNPWRSAAGISASSPTTGHRRWSLSASAWISKAPAKWVPARSRCWRVWPGTAPFRPPARRWACPTDGRGSSSPS